MKRLVICSNGTWQSLSSPYPTNVVKISQAVKPKSSDGISQDILYDDGIGTGDSLDKIHGGITGQGIDKNIQELYRYMCWNYSYPNDEIYLFGFSRGAYTVRSLVGLLNYCGVVSRTDINDVPEAYEIYREEDKQKSQAFRDAHGGSVKIKLLACWDTVGSLGVPNLLNILPKDVIYNKRYKFHNTTLSPIVEYALHAVAIDETRAAFDVTPMEHSGVSTQTLRQVWFPGEHGCVGGGTKEYRGLSDAALLWIMDEIKQLGLGLELDASRIKEGIYIDPMTKFDDPERGIYESTPSKIRELTGTFDDLHESVKIRWKKDSNYRPVNLAKYTSLLNS